MRPKRDGESSRTGGWVGSGTPRHPRPNHVLLVAVAVSHRVQRRVLYVMLLAGGHDFRSHPTIVDEPCRDQHKQDVAVLRRQYAGGFCRGPKHAVSRYSSEWPCCVQGMQSKEKLREAFFENVRTRRPASHVPGYARLHRPIYTPWEVLLRKGGRVTYGLVGTQHHQRIRLDPPGCPPLASVSVCSGMILRWRRGILVR